MAEVEPAPAVAEYQQRVVTYCGSKLYFQNHTSLELTGYFYSLLITA